MREVRMKIDTAGLKFPKLKYYRKPRKKKRKKLSIPKLRDKAWRIFSLYIRLSEADRYGYVRCVTCGKLVEATGEKRECEAGHFAHGLNRECYFDEANVHPQCTRCNRYLSGNMEKYTLFMLEKYGQKVVEELLNSKKVIWKREVLENIFETYKQKLKELEG